MKLPWTKDAGTQPAVDAGAEPKEGGGMIKVGVALALVGGAAAYMAMNGPKAEVPENPGRTVEDGVSVVQFDTAPSDDLVAEMEENADRRAGALAAADQVAGEGGPAPAAAGDVVGDVLAQSAPGSVDPAAAVLPPAPTSVPPAQATATSASVPEKAPPVTNTADESSAVKAYSVQGASLMPGGLVMVPAAGDKVSAAEEREMTLRREAAKGDLSAIFEFYLYLKDRDQASQLGERISLLQKAAAGGVVAAMVELSKAYEAGAGLEKSTANAYAWLTLAAAFGRDDVEEQRLAYAEKLGSVAAEAAQRRAQKLLMEMSPEARQRAKRG